MTGAYFSFVRRQRMIFHLNILLNRCHMGIRKKCVSPLKQIPLSLITKSNFVLRYYFFIEIIYYHDFDVF